MWCLHTNCSTKDVFMHIMKITHSAQDCRVKYSAKIAYICYNYKQRSRARLDIAVECDSRSQESLGKSEVNRW